MERGGGGRGGGGKGRGEKGKGGREEGEGGSVEEGGGGLGRERFETLQERFANDDKMNDIYRAGLGPAAVHGFYMYTWASHGMDCPRCRR